MAKTFGVEVLQSDFTDSSGASTANDVTGLSFTAQLGKYYSYKFMLLVTNSVTTRAWTFGINANPTTAATYNIGTTKFPVLTTEGTDAIQEFAINGYADAATVGTDAAYSTSGQIVVIEGLIQPAATQSIFPQLKPEAVAGTITVKANLSHVLWREL